MSREPYDPKSKCPKCDGDTVGTEYHARSFEEGCAVLLCEFEGTGEHFVRECVRCGAVFFQQPIDEGDIMDQLEREITTHHDGHGLNESLRIKADGPGPGGASHHYQVDQQAKVGRRILADIQFQHGPRNEPDSTPGIVEAVLLAILQDRLSAFQAGPYACDENAEALRAIEEALGACKRRADARAERGVLGTYAK
jgi:hypothetical protein